MKSYNISIILLCVAFVSMITAQPTVSGNTTEEVLKDYEAKKGYQDLKNAGFSTQDAANILNNNNTIQSLSPAEIEKAESIRKSQQETERLEKVIEQITKDTSETIKNFKSYVIIFTEFIGKTKKIKRTVSHTTTEGEEIDKWEGIAGKCDDSTWNEILFIENGDTLKEGLLFSFATNKKGKKEYLRAYANVMKISDLTENPYIEALKGKTGYICTSFFETYYKNGNLKKYGRYHGNLIQRDIYSWDENGRIIKELTGAFVKSERIDDLSQSFEYSNKKANENHAQMKISEFK